MDTTALQFSPGISSAEQMQAWAGCVNVSDCFQIPTNFSTENEKLSNCHMCANENCASGTFHRQESPGGKRRGLDRTGHAVAHYIKF